MREAILNLYGRQLSNGGITYWPGDGYENEWVTSYAGSFLVLAKEKGYDVNSGVLSRWKNYQRGAAQNWRANARGSRRYGYYQSDFSQAYRLYTLALAGAPELGAMNRMKELKDLSMQAPALGQLQPGDQTQQGRFAGAAGAILYIPKNSVFSIQNFF